MLELFKPKRNGLLDNLLGASSSLLAAGLLYIQPIFHAACATTRAGAQFYLWWCILPIMMTGALMLAAILFPFMSLFAEKIPLRKYMGVGNLPILYGIALTVCLLFFIPIEPDVITMIPQTFLSGLIAGLVFTVGRDYLASFGKMFQR